MKETFHQSESTLVAQFFGGPGAGKSTTCAGVFSELKNRGLNSEMALEFAKDLCWERSPHLLDNQIYVFGVQHHRLWRLLGQVEVVVTDAPFLHSIVYDQEDAGGHLEALVVSEHHKLWSINFFIGRQKKLNPKGRRQTEEQAHQIDQQVRDLLWRWGVDYHEFPGERESIPSITDLIEEELRRGRP